MAVLARSEILTALEDGSIKIEPKPLLAEVGPASVDLTLSNEFRFYKPGLSVIPINEATDYKSITEKVVIDEEKQQYYLLLPGQACLGITKERIQLSQGLCGLLEGRSRFARMGLFVHITAGFMNPGINNRQVLEIYNASNHPLALYPGTKICQFVFLRMSGEAEYTGKFAHQEL